VPKREKYVPKHRQTQTPVTTVVTEAPRKALRNTLILSAVAVAGTGAAVSAGTFADSSASVSTAAQDLGPRYRPVPAQDLTQRREVTSRSSDRREAADPAKKAELAADKGPAITRHESLAAEDPKDIARALLPQFGFSSDQFGCLDELWTGESDWRVDADNPTSSAYGIPQALPGEKMASAGADWATNPATQIKWGLGYIKTIYGDPCKAWAFWQVNHYY